MSYEDRLKFLNLPTLCYRKLRGDMIKSYTILNKKYDSKIIPNLFLNNSARTRGNKCKLKITRAKNDLKKHSFCLQVPKIWNSLSDKVVNSQPVKSLKFNLDNHWTNKKILYNYKVPPL